MGNPSVGNGLRAVPCISKRSCGTGSASGFLRQTLAEPVPHARNGTESVPYRVAHDRLPSLNYRAYSSTSTKVASRVIAALSTFDTGQPALAMAASFSKVA